MLRDQSCRAGVDGPIRRDGARSEPVIRVGFSSATTTVETSRCAQARNHSIAKRLIQRCTLAPMLMVTHLEIGTLRGNALIQINVADCRWDWCKIGRASACRIFSFLIST
jgi:hypothetical protein